MPWKILRMQAPKLSKWLYNFIGVASHQRVNEAVACRFNYGSRCSNIKYSKNIAEFATPKAETAKVQTED